MNSSIYRQLLGATLVVGAILVMPVAKAHIKNEASQFPDIEYSDARFDIVLLVGAGVIPETPVFEPDKNLSRKELAAWAGLAKGLGKGGETPDTEALAGAAREAGLVPDLAGDATWKDLATVFFGDSVSVAAPEAVPTKGEAARFIAANLDTGAGKALLEPRNIRAGATGVVSSIETREGHHGNAYVMTIGSESLAMDEHGRVANGPTDLLQWEGRNVRRSFVRAHHDSAQWIYLEAEPEQSPPPPAETSAVTTDEPPSPPPEERKLMWWLVGVVVILALILFFRRRSK